MWAVAARVSVVRQLAAKEEGIGLLAMPDD